MENKKEIVKCLEGLIQGSSQARKWYLKTDLKVRLKLLVNEDQGLDEFIYLWKRLNIIKKDFGDFSQEIINETVQELAQELKSNDGWVKRANAKLIELLDLKDEDVRIL
ncbi:MAG: hypothetical protein FWB86_13790 [Treponema sp.]|nr:hypothetical protein [Treponema sp.]